MDTQDKYNFLRQVIKYINQDITQEALEYFIEGLSEQSLGKNEMYIKPDEIHKQIGFVAKGLLRGFYIDKKGNEINTRFLKEGNFVTHYSAFIMQVSSNYYFKTIEPSELLCFDYNHIQNCYKQFPSFEKFGRLMAEEIIKKMDERLESQQFDDAEKRYNDFVTDYPDLNNRLSLEQISSYIRITRPALSRLRGKKT